LALSIHPISVPPYRLFFCTGANAPGLILSISRSLGADSIILGAMYTVILFMV
jgi:hypothetical protein